ncbi:hypothetical protein MRX96_001699 [Rhipicephalus microplus]
MEDEGVVIADVEPDVFAVLLQSVYTGLSVETAADTLILSHQHDAHALRCQALDFVCSHMDDVVETPGRATICKSHIELLEQLLMTLINERGEPPLKISRSS